jgi:hypothetical protein
MFFWNLCFRDFVLIFSGVWFSDLGFFLVLGYPFCGFYFAVEAVGATAFTRGDLSRRDHVTYA